MSDLFPDGVRVRELPLPPPHPQAGLQHPGGRLEVLVAHLEIKIIP